MNLTIPFRTLLLTSLLPSTLGLAAQCDFTPTIDPPDLMMCPLTTDTLSTEEYDSYQWYKDGEPIPGATQRQLVVDYYSSVTFDFHVEVSLDGCTAQSDSTHVNGWAFLSPTVYTSGAVPYAVDNNGTALYCEGDVVQLTLGLPYVRTSVDHGTALDLAGKACADPGSLFAATRLAMQLAAQRHR